MSFHIHLGTWRPSNLMKVVATVAFGLGIDKGDVRYLHNLGISLGICLNDRTPQICDSLRPSHQF